MVETPWLGYRSYPERLNITREVLEQSLDEGLGTKPGLLYDRGIITYADLKRQVDAVARNLKQLDLRTGELVLIRMPNSPEFAIAFLAIIKAGAVPVLVNSLLGAAELATILDQAQPRIVLTESSRAQAIRELRKDSSVANIVCAGRAEATDIPFESLLQNEGETLQTAGTAANDLAFIVYTSGTTGRPKGIMHAHRWIRASGDLNRLRLPPKEDDVTMATGEWSFISALGHNLLFPLRNRVSCAILSGRATPENVLATIERHRVTVLYSVATLYRRILAIPNFERRYNLTSLRCANSTGEALGEAAYQEWKRRVGCEVYEHYGVSEFQLVMAQGPRQPVRPGSIGKTLPGVEVAIVDDNHQPVRPGELSHFVIPAKDPALFLGYYKDPERTSSCFKSGWFHTGDLAYQDDDGYFYIAGRSDECFKSRGIFISPSEIENALQKHPAVLEAAVIPDPDPEIGNKIRAVVVLAEGYDPSDNLAQSIRDNLRVHIAPFKVPHKIEFTEALPKSPVGKIRRSELTNGR